MITNFWVCASSIGQTQKLVITVENLWNSRATGRVEIRQVSAHYRAAGLGSARLINGALRMSGVKEPRLTLAALNPHGGEGGWVGTEEVDALVPAIRRAWSEGINAQGPFPPDTIFVRARNDASSAVVSMYHDQGNIALKMMGFGKGVTVHGGLPLPIVTPAHGVAYDIAAKVVAKPQVLRQAFLLAASMGAA